MEPAQFLGGKYRNPERFASDPIEGFRAREAKTGRYVFVHRVSLSERPEEQARLLRLLLTATFRSVSVRKMILDFGEDEGSWYVVTEGEPECLLLKNWLESEINKNQDAPVRTGEGPEPPEEIETLIGPMPISEKPHALSAMPEAAVSDSGEFTRIFRPDSTSRKESGLPESVSAKAEPGIVPHDGREWPPPTRVVQRPVLASSVTAAAVKPGEYTRLVRPDRKLDTSPATAAGTVTPETKVILARPAVSEVKVQSSTARRTKSNQMPILFFAVLGVVAVLLVLVLVALKK